MTEEQLATAREYEDYHPNSFGFKNTRFLQGFLESLDKNEGLQPESFDVIISNCVLNLCKPAILESRYKLLKPGGEMYFSDIYANRCVSIELQKNRSCLRQAASGPIPVAWRWRMYSRGYSACDSGHRSAGFVSLFVLTLVA
jgi:arsenite methyltransferase